MQNAPSAIVELSYQRIGARGGGVSAKGAGRIFYRKNRSDASLKVVVQPGTGDEAPVWLKLLGGKLFMREDPSEQWSDIPRQPDAPLLKILRIYHTPVEPNLAFWFAESGATFRHHQGDTGRGPGQRYTATAPIKLLVRHTPAPQDDVWKLYRNLTSKPLRLTIWLGPNETLHKQSLTFFLAEGHTLTVEGVFSAWKAGERVAPPPADKVDRED